MHPDMKRAWIQAAVKLGVGSALVAAMLGIRMVTATSEAISTEIAEVASPESGFGPQATSEELTALPGSADGSAEATAEGEAEGESFVARLGASVGDRLPIAETKPYEGDQLVSCRFQGSAQFMRADDCAMRGGRANLFEDER